MGMSKVVSGINVSNTDATNVRDVGVVVPERQLGPVPVIAG
jgi:hypothetical protein